MALQRPTPKPNRPSLKGGAVLPPTPLGNKRGRKAGTPNKHTRLFKDACLLAAECVGMPEVERNEKGEPGTRSSISPGKSCRSPAAIGLSSVTQSED
jgi:hypothetical protein